MDPVAFILQTLREVQSQPTRMPAELTLALNQLFPKLKGALLINFFATEQLHLTPELTAAARVIAAEIENTFPLDSLEAEIGIEVREENSVEYRKFQLFRSIHQFLKAFFSTVEGRLVEFLCSSRLTSTNASDSGRYESAFPAFVDSLISAYLSGKRDTVINMIQLAAALQCDEIQLPKLISVEDSLKKVFTAYTVFASMDYLVSWRNAASLACDVLEYFCSKRAVHHRPEQFWQAVRSLIRVIEHADGVEEAYLRFRQEYKVYSEQFPAVWGNLLFLVDRNNARLGHWATLFEKDGGGELDRRFAVVMRWRDDLAIQADFLRALVEFTVLDLLVEEDSLDVENPNGRRVLEYFLSTARRCLEEGCYLSCFGRMRYALRSSEVMHVLVDKLKLRCGERFLDMFANVPIASWAAAIIGANVSSVDMAFVELDSFTEYYRRLREMILCATGTSGPLSLDFEISPTDRAWSPPGGAFSSRGVNPQALDVFFNSYFLLMIQRRRPLYYRHEYKLSDDGGDELLLEENSFDKVSIDPPYGRETGKEGFGPDEALLVAKKGIRDASRLVKRGGLAVLTLPSLKWKGYPGLEWRRGALDFAVSQGLSLAEGDLHEGRALVLLRRER